jgi:hypothetical protein
MSGLPDKVHSLKDHASPCEFCLLTCFEQIAHEEDNVQDVHLTDVHAIGIHHWTARDAGLCQSLEYGLQEVVLVSDQDVVPQRGREQQRARMVVLHWRSSEPKTQRITLR